MSPSSTTTTSNATSIPPSVEQALLLQSARMKLSSKDQEAMKRMRSTMLEYPESSSSKSSPLSSRFPILTSGSNTSTNTHESGDMTELRNRRSTLSRQVTTDEMALEQESIERGASSRPVIPDQITRRNGSTTPPSANADYVIAVVGHESVGKSTVIGRALRTWGMSHPVKTHTSGGHTILSCYSQIQPGGKLKGSWKVEFIELNIQSLNVSSTSSTSQTIWPEGLSNVSGVILCYDAGRRDTLSGMSEILERLSPTGVPMVMLACKSDLDAKLEVDAPLGNSIGEPFNVGLIEVTIQTSEGKSKMRNALRWILYKLEQRQRRQQRKHATTELTIPQHPPSPSLASATLEALSPDSDTSSSADKIMWHQRGLNMTPTDQDGADGLSDHRSSGSSLSWVTKGPPPRLSLEMEPTKIDSKPKEPKDAQKESPATQASRNNDGSSPHQRSLTQTGSPIDAPLWLTAEQLLNKLFAAIVSSQDESFIRAFKMTYRRFMFPKDLMNEFLVRLEEVETYDVSRDVKNWTMMKVTGALVDWTTRYPGDLADLSTQSIFKEILALILHHTFMAHLTGELIMIEHSLSESIDLDQSWSLKSTSPDSPSVSSLQPSLPNTELVIGTEVLYEYNSLIDPPDTPFSSSSKEQNPPTVRTISTSSLPIDMNRKTSSPNSSSGSGLESGVKVGFGTDERSGLNGGHNAELNLNFQRWIPAVNMIINMDPRGFAMELTKMQWSLFAAIRPRDVLGHDLGKETNGPVGRSIAFFNHISRWVSTIILAHPKAKHRARIIEKFIMITHQLRRLNNYDSLYAVISGLRETSIHRLSVTQSLITLPINLEKEYQSHLKLMDPRGGYVHYRRALQSDNSNERCSIPLLTNILGMINRLQNVRKQDIRSVPISSSKSTSSQSQQSQEQSENDKGNLSTVNDDNTFNGHPDETTKNEIQWDKFSKFGEILNVIIECQSRGPIIRGEINQNFKKIIEDTAIISNEDGLYERSQFLEPSGGGTVGGKVLKRLVNLGFS
ncbi:uncharacterized protein IL334_003284 [Kwoniella shivajii]|uniref:Ras guanyl-nucleotide exchange factor n=1 Tax=Kwoniella shivajii TaxID=564305 RepID=A0ABZ1CYE8_9TREE|nr:hypothetical protein IL334_003284 [Kwoniella shivajii]